MGQIKVSDKGPEIAHLSSQKTAVKRQSVSLRGESRNNRSLRKTDPESAMTGGA